eukprot:g16868.t1
MFHVLDLLLSGLFEHRTWVEDIFEQGGTEERRCRWKGGLGKAPTAFTRTRSIGHAASTHATDRLEPIRAFQSLEQQSAVAAAALHCATGRTSEHNLERFVSAHTLSSELLDQIVEQNWRTASLLKNWRQELGRVLLKDCLLKDWRQELGRVLLKDW